MPTDLAPLAHANGGHLTRGQLNQLGLSDAQIRQTVRDRLLVRVRHGIHVPRDLWDTSSPEQRHVILARAVVAKLGGAVAASHHTACALHGEDLHDLDLAEIHVTRLDGGPGRREAGVVHHEGGVVPSRDLREVEGLLVMEPARAAIEAASLASIESGMVVMSSALRAGRAGAEELEARLDDFAHWPGMRAARMAAQLSDARFESVGEVRSFHMMWRFAIPRPELQRVLLDRNGTIIARSDFYWEKFRHVGEFDGMLKYGRGHDGVIDPGRVVEREKVREDKVRALDLGMSRWIWVDLAISQQPRTAHALRAAMERSRRLYARNATTIPL